MRSKNNSDLSFFLLPRTLILFLFGIFAFCEVASCGKKENTDVTPNTEQNAGIVPNTETKKGSMSTELGGETKAAAGTVLELKGKAFGKLPIVGEEDPILCNLPENIMSGPDSWECMIPICRDPLYGITYYRNFGRDEKIYALKDGVSEVAIELSGRRLFCRKGKLYFLAETKGEFSLPGAKDGNLLSYNPVDGSITLIFEEIFGSVVIYQDLIYVKENPKENEAVANCAGWFYFFESDTWMEAPKGDDYILDIQRYGEYFMAATMKIIDPADWAEETKEWVALWEKENPGKPVIVRETTNSRICRFDGSKATSFDNLQIVGTPYTYYVKGENIIWYRNIDDTFHSYHIPSREETTIPLNPDIYPNILFQGKVFSGQGAVTELETGKQFSCTFISSFLNQEDKAKELVQSDAIPMPVQHVEEYYTDGENLYAILEVDYITRESIFVLGPRLFFLEYEESAGGSKLYVNAPQ